MRGTEAAAAAAAAFASAASLGTHLEDHQGRASDSLLDIRAYDLDALRALDPVMFEVLALIGVDRSGADDEERKRGMLRRV